MGNSKEIKEQLIKYQQLLLQALTIEKDIRFINEYKQHQARLIEIEKDYLMNDFNSLLQTFESETHYYGWSFLPDEHGKNVESAFWQLKSMIIPEEK